MTEYPEPVLPYVIRNLGDGTLMLWADYRVLQRLKGQRYPFTEFMSVSSRVAVINLDPRYNADDCITFLRGEIGRLLEEREESTMAEDYSVPAEVWVVASLARITKQRWATQQHGEFWRIIVDGQILYEYPTKVLMTTALHTLMVYLQGEALRKDLSCQPKP